MLRYGNGAGKLISGKWMQEAENIELERIPNPNMLNQLKEKLLSINPKIITVGHGFCMKCELQSQPEQSTASKWARPSSHLSPLVGAYPSVPEPLKKALPYGTLKTNPLI